MNQRLDATLAFDGAVTAVRAVAGARAAALGKMGIATVRDLLTHFPRRYIDMSTLSTVGKAAIGQGCTIVGNVHKVELKRPASKPYLSLTEITLVDGTGTLIITCFRQPWLAEKLAAGQRIAVSGKLEFNYGFKRMTNPFIEQLDTTQEVPGGMVVPVHPATAKVPTSLMRTLVGNALELCRGVEDPLPIELRTRYRLMSRASALQSIHFPQSMEQATQARRRLAYEEVLLLQVHLMREHNESTQGKGVSHVIDGPRVSALRKAIPFALTEEQDRAVAEIFQRMAAPKPAHHMLLGDVGTGKTVVAAFALAAAADTGGQALMMAPTEVLATQYGQALGPLLDAAGIRWGLLCGSTSAEDRSHILQDTAAGQIDVLFGTHALIEPGVKLKQCTLVVIDEQQRFGVEQRQALVNKGNGPDVLSLTATPIPRSLALALYGNTTLSYIKTRPKNHAETTTRVVTKSVQGEAFEIADAALQAGQQVFVVCPLVGAAPPKKTSSQEHETDEEDDYVFGSIAIEDDADLQDTDAKAAIQEAEYLQAKVFGGYTVGVLHGRMPSEEKQQVMDDFRAGDIQVLVATTVIEVGVDVPNATVMIVEDADRFGLAQLHQLRGRVGRGTAPGTVCLISGTKAPAALERLAAMERTNDGFALAEYDLSLRREGDILGNRQHGASVLKLVNVVRDAAIIETAHDDAQALIEADPDLSRPEHRALRYELSRVFEAESSASSRKKDAPCA